MSVTCTSREIIEYLNPSYKHDVFPESACIVLPKENISDFLLNEESNYKTMSLINDKQVLIDEDRIIYTVLKGDYLGKIAKKYNVNIYNLKKWNKLKTSKINEGEKMVIFAKNLVFFYSFLQFPLCFCGFPLVCLVFVVFPMVICNPL